MIEITLKFTSMALAAAALNQLNGQQLATASVVDTAAPVLALVPPPKPKAEKPAAAPTPAAPAASTPSAAPAPSAAPTAPSVDYPTLQKAVFKLAGLPDVGRAAATEVSASFGVKTFKDLDSARWADAHVAVLAKIEELAEAVA